MVIKIPVSQVVNPQRLDTRTTRSGGNPATFADQRTLIVYAGWIVAPFANDDGHLVHDVAVSFVPNSDGRPQTFKEGNQTFGRWRRSSRRRCRASTTAATGPRRS